MLAVQGAVHFAFVFAGLERSAFVAQGLPATKRDRHFGDPAFVEVDAQGDQRQTLLLDLRPQLTNLTGVDEQLATP